MGDSVQLPCGAERFNGRGRAAGMHLPVASPGSLIILYAADLRTM
jgi:hypothetical protein